MSPDETSRRVVHPTGADDASLVERVLEHARTKTTDLSPESTIHEEPVDNFRSPRRLELERDLVLARRPRVICHFSEVANSGDYVATEVLGVPVVVVRTQSGALAAHRNVCSHRGMDVVAKGSGTTKGFVCRYHGWTYDLDGTLVSVPRREQGYPGLACERLGLVRVTVSERFGLVWVQLGEGAENTAPNTWLDDYLGSVADEIDPIGLENMKLFRASEQSVPIHWKTLIEGFLEGYHIRTTHRDSFYPMGFDTLNVEDTFGAHTRIVYPYQRILSLAERPREEWMLHRLATVVYHLFPATLVVVNAMHTTALSMEPISTTETHIRRFHLAPPSMLEHESEKLERDLEFVDIGLEEDFEAGQRITRGLANNPNPVLRYGRFEGHLIHFLRQIDEIIERKG